MKGMKGLIEHINEIRLAACYIVFHLHGFFFSKKYLVPPVKDCINEVHAAFSSPGVGKTIEAIIGLKMPRLHAGDSQLRDRGDCSFS